MQRIRYIKEPDGCLRSMQIFLSSDRKNEFVAYVMPGGRHGAIVDARTGNVVYEVQGTSAHKTKIAIKETLGRMNVTFREETRNRV